VKSRCACSSSFSGRPGVKREKKTDDRGKSKERSPHRDAGCRPASPVKQEEIAERRRDEGKKNLRDRNRRVSLGKFRGSQTSSPIPRKQRRPSGEVKGKEKDSQGLYCGKGEGQLHWRKGLSILPSVPVSRTKAPIEWGRRKIERC